MIMELSCKCEYALLALVELAQHYSTNQPLQIRQMAANQHIPDRYLEQLLAMLRRGGVLRSVRGARGGYILAREPWRINLQDVLQCLEGIDAEATPLREQEPTLEGIVVRELWQEVQQAMAQVYIGYTLQDLLERRESRQRLDIMYYI
jgi:Rrf2 family protein